MSLLDRLDVLKEVLTVLPVGVWLMDDSGKILYGNPAGQRIWGGARYVGMDQFGQYKGWWVPSGQRIEPEQWAAARAIRKGETSIDEEVEIECFDGSHKFILNSAMPIREKDGRIVGAIIVNHDITDRKRAEERLRSMAEHDSLTGAYSRRYLFEFLGGEIERAKRYKTPLSILMFDIDHFKKVNDDYGHQAGDRVLVRLAAIVMQELREADRLGRYGGEEFLVVAPGINRVQAAALAERLRHRIAQAAFDSMPPLTCSFGVCELYGDDSDTLVRRADELLYEAKNAGRDRVVSR